jgi:hypothetical protein
MIHSCNWQILCCNLFPIWMMNSENDTSSAHIRDRRALTKLGRGQIGVRTVAKFEGGIAMKKFPNN